MVSEKKRSQLYMSFFLLLPRRLGSTVSHSSTQAKRKYTGFGLVLLLLLPAMMQCRLLFSRRYALVQQCKDVLFSQVAKQSMVMFNKEWNVIWINTSFLSSIPRFGDKIGWQPNLCRRAPVPYSPSDLDSEKPFLT